MSILYLNHVVSGDPKRELRKPMQDHRVMPTFDAAAAQLRLDHVPPRYQLKRRVFGRVPEECRSRNLDRNQAHDRIERQNSFCD